MFNKTAFLQAIKPKTTVVDIEDFGPVTLRQLTVAEIDAQHERMKDAKADAGKDYFGLRLLVASVVDENGTPALSEDDIKQLLEASNGPIEKLTSKVMELNGFGKAEAKN